MKLADALKRINASQQNATPPQWTLHLVCGFTPLHFETFLHAALLERSARPFTIETGLYGDLPGTLGGLVSDVPVHAVVAIEWADLDPRLGLRTTHGWRAARGDDIIETVHQRTEQLANSMGALAEGSQLVVSLPTLPLPPAFREPTRIASPLALALRASVLDGGARFAALRGVHVLDPQALDHASPPDTRHDPRGELQAGFPYTKAHASALAHAHAAALVPPAPKKGLITDLDDTLWKGLVGEAGVDGVSWDLDHRAQLHGLYQETLASLLEQGVLIGVASKNEPEVVTQALKRPDLVLDASQLFPVEASWGPKSEAVASILDAWNISARDAVFIDDTPLELAEVGAAFPEMECITFPKQNEAEGLEFLRTLRDRFGRSQTRAEDALRAESLRVAHAQRATRAADPEAFLASANATLQFTFADPDTRALELVNKTNQFNLNGRRWDAGEWAIAAADANRFIVTVSYQDKFGPLGKIAVAAGTRQPELCVDSWVLSCRAFSRRIEHQMLDTLFEAFGTDSIAFEFAKTERNGPLQAFFATWIAAPANGRIVIAKEHFDANHPPLYGKVTQA